VIARYSRPEMTGIWSEESKFARWFEVELAALEGWAHIGTIPASAVVDYDGDHDHGDDNFGGNVMAGPPPYARLSVFKWFGTI